MDSFGLLGLVSGLHDFQFFCFISCPSPVSDRFGAVSGCIGFDWGASGLGWDLFGLP